MTRQFPKQFYRVLLLAALLVACGYSVLAQSDANKGQIVGTVFDQKQAVVPGAKVKVQNTGTGAVRALTTSAEGQFRAVLLDPGQYDVTVEAAGFAPAVLSGVVVNVGSAVNLPVPLTLGTTAQTIEVSSNFGADLPSPATVINSAVIEGLPINGRRFTDFAALTPTVQIDPTRGSISFAGQRGINGNVMVDGADYNNPFFGGTRGGERSGFVFTVPQVSIEEFQAVTTGYAAEYGRSTGGVLNAITKSGSNAMHGEAFYQIRHKETGLKTPFNVQILETLQQFGGGAGGAIKKDKIFWFGAAERQLSKSPHQVLFGSLVGLAPTPQTAGAINFYHSLEGTYGSTNDATAANGRIDYQLSNAHRVTTRFNFSDASANNAITTGAPIPTLVNRALNGSGSEKDRTYTGIGDWTWILSPNTANDLRYSGTHEVRPRTANSAIPNVSATSAIGDFGSRNFLPTVQDDTRHQFTDSLSLTHGTHTFKFGGDYNYLTTYQSFGFNQFGSFSFLTSDLPTILSLLTVAPGQNLFDNTTVQYRREIGNLQADYHMHQIAFFGQDSWRVNPRLQINYGLRWEGQVNPLAVGSNTPVVQAIQATTFPINGKFDPATLHNNLHQWMPRFGFTFTPVKGSTKTVIRGHAGLFYAASPMLIYGGTTNNFRQPPGDVSLLLGGGGQTIYQLFKGIGVDLNTFSLDKLPVLSIDQVTQAAALATGTAPNPFNQASFTGTTNDYQNPRSFQAGFGVDREVARGWVTSVQLNYLNTVHLERNRDYNLPVPTLRALDGRYVFNRANRPLPQFGQITLRESSARSMYRGMTFSTRYSTGRVQFGSEYTVSQNYSADDNERDATGFTYDNPFNLKLDYGYSNLDVRHHFANYAVGKLPWGIELSGIFRFTSGQPINPLVGSDLNGDTSSASDRPFLSPGTVFRRNSFRNHAYKTVDVRFIKNFNVSEKLKLQFSTEMFNLFNFANVVFQNPGINSVNLRYGPGVNTDGTTASPLATFMRLRLANGQYDPNNTQAGTPFQAQFGLRATF